MNSPTANCRDMLLVVDDQEVNRAILCEAFKDDYKVIEAADGVEAQAQLERYSDKIVAVLLDIVMPRLDGFGVLEWMNRVGLMSSIPVFLITSDDSSESMAHGYRLGAMDIITKPIIVFVVRRRVSSIVELYSAREKLAMRVQTQARVLDERALEIQRLNNSVIESLATAIEFRDCESGQHVRRMHDLTWILLKDMRDSGFEGCSFDDEQIEQIATAAIMHDVGKIAIPDCILNKPGRLTNEEFDIMKQHTVKGCELLARITKTGNNPMYKYAYDICRHHHEKWDGRGYPDGLAETQIEVWSQVVALADCYDALTNERVYKPAYTHEESVHMILNGECGMFNPALLESFRARETQIRTTAMIVDVQNAAIADSVVSRT